MKATLPVDHAHPDLRLATSCSDWWFILFPLIAAIIIFAMPGLRSPKGKPVWDRFALKAPIFGSLVRLLAISRFARTLATLLKSGVPAADRDGHRQERGDQLGARRRGGEGPGRHPRGREHRQPLKRSGEFPPLVYHMVAIGERSGQLEDMLLSVADSYENQVNVRIGALTSMLEPLLIVVMGVIIAFVAFSILMPILQVNSAIR